jgi:ATP-dependent helicase/nuclease subunit A
MDQGQARRDNLLTVYQLTLNWAAGGYLYLYQLLRLLDRAAESGVQATTQVTEGVTLTTMHSSKGLEYPVVVLADLSRKFNFRELSDPLLFDSDLGIGAKITDMDLRVRYPGLCYEALKVKKTRSLLSEELRILYVAMTRPKDYLIMTYSKEKLENTLTRLRPGAGLPAEPWAVSGVGCLGDWVLLSALGRVEAGELFSLCGRPDCQLAVSEHPWQIHYTLLDQTAAPQGRVWTEHPEQETEISVPMPEQLLQQLQWQDSHQAASRTPSKLTATQLKGREKDSEAADGAKVPASTPQLRRPEFILEKQGLSPTERGTAVHLFLQYADFSQCETLDGIQREKYRLEDAEFMTAQQLEAVDPSTIAALFHSSLGQRMLHAKQLIREFKFSILEDAARHYDEVDGEQVLLQGVVDAAIVEPDGLAVIDFKTDRVTDAAARAQVYAGQLSAYRDALSRIFDRPVKEMILYFLHTGEVVTL